MGQPMGQPMMPMMAQPAMMTTIAYVPVMGYAMPQQHCIPPQGYPIPKPD